MARRFTPARAFIIIMVAETPALCNTRSTADISSSAGGLRPPSHLGYALAYARQGWPIFPCHGMRFADGRASCTCIHAALIGDPTQCGCGHVKRGLCPCSCGRADFRVRGLGRPCQRPGVDVNRICEAVGGRKASVLAAIEELEKRQLVHRKEEGKHARILPNGRFDRGA